MTPRLEELGIKKKQIDYIIKKLKQADTGYFKAEFEGNVYDSEFEGNSYCEYCEEGTVSCSNCDGTGDVYTYDQRDNEYINDCYDCEGNGRETCPECDGNYEDYGSDFDFDYFVECLKATLTTEERDAITYMRGYNDGTVNTEITATYELSAAGISAYLGSIQYCNNKFDNTQGGGFHLSLLHKYSNGRYPNTAYCYDDAAMGNFQQEVQKLLPAMYVLGSSNHTTRPLAPFRQAKINDDKYSAIHLVTEGYHEGGVVALEFRLFDPCYKNLQIAVDYLEVIAKSMMFYVYPTLKAPQISDKALLQDGDRTIRFVSSFFDTYAGYLMVKRTIGILSPRGKDFATILRERNMSAFIKDSKAKKYAAKKLATANNEYYNQLALYQKELKDVSLRKHRNTITEIEANQLTAMVIDKYQHILHNDKSTFVNNVLRNRWLTI